MESVPEESQQEVSQEDQSNEGQPKQETQEGQLEQKEQHHGNDPPQKGESVHGDKNSERNSPEGDQAKPDKPVEQPVKQPTDLLVETPAEPSDSSKPLSPSPSLLIITPHDSAFAQMESFLQIQIDKCVFYKNIFQQQSNTSLTAKFQTFLSLTEKDIEMLRKTWKDGGRLPGYKFETIRVTCTPTNVDIKEKELQIVVKTSNLPVAYDARTYVIGQFEFPTTGQRESMTQAAHKWLKRLKIEPREFFCCSKQTTQQADIAYSTSVKPFYDTDSKLTEYTNPLTFFVDKGR